MDFSQRIRPHTVRSLQRELGLGSYDKIRLVIVGQRPPSVALAKRIQAATDGRIHWTEFFETETDHMPQIAA